MDTLARHELFEIEVLETLKSARLLEPLVFGGGTMLRLCFELHRYSVDLDFWFFKKVSPAAHFNKLKKILGEHYEVTDAQQKFYTLLIEIRSPRYPHRLKIEIRKGLKACDCEERIAFSEYTTRQVALRVHSLEQTMKNKVAALLERKEIRDGFDIEFLLRQGIPFSEMDAKQRASLKFVVEDFKERDFKVKLGSIIKPDMRAYYQKNKFSYLLSKLG